MTAECPYTLQWDAPFPLKIAPSHGDPNPHLIHGSLGPPESSIQTASQSVQPFLQGSLVWHADRPTDHATRSVRIGRAYVRSTSIQPNSDNFNADQPILIPLAGNSYGVWAIISLFNFSCSFAITSLICCDITILYKPMAKSMGKGKLQPHSSETAWSILMKFEP